VAHYASFVRLYILKIASFYLESFQSTDDGTQPSKQEARRSLLFYFIQLHMLQNQHHVS
jgi:hypothetical protein